MAFLRYHPPPWAAAALLAAGLLLTFPPSARAGPRGGDSIQGLANAIDQVMGLVLQADQKGKDVPGLDKALQELVGVLTHEHHHKHHHHHGLAAGAMDMGDGFGAGDAAGQAGNVGKQAGADGGKNGQGRGGQGGRQGRNHGGKDSGKALAQVGGRCGCQGKQAQAQANQATGNTDPASQGNRLGRGVGDMTGAVHCRDRGARQGDGQSVQTKSGSGKEGTHRGMHCQVGQQAGVKQPNQTANQSSSGKPKQPANQAPTGKPPMSKPDGPRLPANQAPTGKPAQLAKQPMSKPDGPRLPAATSGTPTKKQVAPGDQAASAKRTAKPGSTTPLAGMLTGLMKPQRQKAGTVTARASSMGPQAVLKGAPKGVQPNALASGGAGHTVGHAKGGGGNPSHGAQRTAAPRGGSPGRRK